MYTPLQSSGVVRGCQAASIKALGLVLLPSLIAFVVLDLLWITVVAKDLYAGLKPILKDSPDVVAAQLSWLCIVLANYVFVLPRTGGGTPAWKTIGQGVTFGVLLYGTVDLTNCALVKEWTWLVTLVDMLWGALACSVLAIIQRTLCDLFPSLGM